MRFIIDSSVALSWCFLDEATPETESLYSLALRSEIVVPPLWHIEVANILGIAVRRKRISADALMTAMQTLQLLYVHTIEQPRAQDIQGQLFAIMSSGLTAYDAVYLQLAIQERLPLASFDQKLVQAARLAGVTIVEPEGP